MQGIPGFPSAGFGGWPKGLTWTGRITALFTLRIDIFWNVISNNVIEFLAGFASRDTRSPLLFDGACRRRRVAGVGAGGARRSPQRHRLAPWGLRPSASDPSHPVYAIRSQGGSNRTITDRGKVARQLRHGCVATEPSLAYDERQYRAGHA